MNNSKTNINKTCAFCKEEFAGGYYILGVFYCPYHFAEIVKNRGCVPIGITTIDPSNIPTPIGSRPVPFIQEQHLGPHGYFQPQPQWNPLNQHNPFGACSGPSYFDNSQFMPSMGDPNTNPDFPISKECLEGLAKAFQSKSKDCFTKEELLSTELTAEQLLAMPEKERTELYEQVLLALTKCQDFVKQFEEFRKLTIDKVIQSFESEICVHCNSKLRNNVKEVNGQYYCNICNNPLPEDKK